MTTTEAKARLIKVATDELGYLEKKSNANLDSKTANAGKRNFTKFTRDLMKWLTGTGDMFRQGYAWCVIFVTWCYIVAFGKDAAKKLLRVFTSYSPELAREFYDRGRLKKDPVVGAIIFFADPTKASSSRWKGVYHVGIVENYGNKYVTAIEGNTGAGSGVIENGGCVRRKTYLRSNAKIFGYGVPDFSVLKDEDAVNEEAVNVTLAKKEEDEVKIEDPQGFIKDLYVLLFDRQPDEGGLKTWTEFLTAHSSAELVRELAFSAERAPVTIEQMYQRHLGRIPTAEEVETWRSTGLSPHKVAEKIERSKEAKAHWA